MPGRRLALFTNNDSAYRAAVALKKAGAAVVAIADVRPELSAEMRKLATEAEAEIFAGHAIVAAAGIPGRGRGARGRGGRENGERKGGGGKATGEESGHLRVWTAPGSGLIGPVPLDQISAPTAPA